MLHCLVVTHGKLGEELLHVVSLVYGEVAGLSSLSNHGRNLDLVVGDIERLRDDARREGASGLVILVDHYGGSCANAALAACGQERDIAILSGVNLSMLLDFAAWRDRLDLAEMVQRLVQKGREAIRRVQPL
jgi:PTS system mannose-specific IIA component